MARRFDGKSIIVTGGARGLGKATAQRFLEEGGRVLIADVKAELLEETQNEFAKLGPVVSVVTDVRDKAQVEAMVQTAVREFGGLDVLCSIAGIAYEEPFLDIPEEHFDDIIAVNLKGVFLCGQAAGRVMAQKKQGVIVNMGSTNGIVGEAKYAHYDASKGGVVNMTRTMAIDLAPFGIRVNAVCPGYIVTPMSQEIDDEEFVRNYIKNFIPIGRSGVPEDVSGVFAFLASDDAAFITGASVVVDGGQLTF